jgi:Domain of unknown function (DUF222)
MIPDVLLRSARATLAPRTHGAVSEFPDGPVSVAWRRPDVSPTADTIERMFDITGLDDQTVGAASAASVDAREPMALPAGLDTIDPGPVLASLLSTIDVHRVSDEDRITVLMANQRLASHFQAKVLDAMVSVVDALSPELGDFAPEAAAAEIQAALRLTRRSADLDLSLALALRRRLPEVFSRMADGQIDIRRARVIDRYTIDLSPASTDAVVSAIIDRAHRLTTGQLAAELRRLRLSVDSDESRRRYEAAVEARRVWIESTPDGTANLYAFDLPPDRAASIRDRLDQAARSMAADDDRSMDQRRADAFLDLCDGVDAEALPTRRGVVDIHVGLETLARLRDDPGDMGGFGPVVADIARQVVDRQPDAEWRYTITDQESGLPIGGGITRRRPTADQRRTVESRSHTCIFPGCRMPASRSDLDHRIPWSERRTTRSEDLAPLCRHHHRIRHLANWSYGRLDRGDHRWTSPLKRTYTTSGAPP